MDVVALDVLLVALMLLVIVQLVPLVRPGWVGGDPGGDERWRLRRLERRLDLARERLGAERGPVGHGALPADVAEALDAGNRIIAVRRYRAATGSTLADATRAIGDTATPTRCRTSNGWWTTLLSPSGSRPRTTPWPTSGRWRPGGAGSTRSNVIARPLAPGCAPQRTPWIRWTAGGDSTDPTALGTAAVRSVARFDARRSAARGWRWRVRRRPHRPPGAPREGRGRSG